MIFRRFVVALIIRLVLTGAAMATTSQWESRLRCWRPLSRNYGGL